MENLQYVIDLIPTKYRKYAIYGPLALALSVIAAVGIYDAAMDTWEAPPEFYAVAAVVSSAGHLISYKKTDVPVESE